LSQKKAPPKRGSFAAGAADWLEPPPEAPEVAVPVVPVAPVAGAAPVPATSRLPSSSASTRRSGCRQETSFRLLAFSGPMRLQVSPVIGFSSPRPSTWMRLWSTPCEARYSATACARRSERSLL
jgi:hypothetical protein